MSGTLKLAARGVQDKWLVEEPQMSYFFVNYKRHSKFSQEQIELPFNGEQDFGNELFCEIPYSKGDIVRNFALRLTLNDIEDRGVPETIKGSQPSYRQTINLPYVPSLCTELVEFADLYIGGQLIERLTGEYIYMHQQLHNTDNDIKRGLRKINGHGDFIDNHDDDALDDVYGLVGTTSEDYNKNIFHTYILDLPFYFYRETSLAIPLCAISRQKIVVRIKLRTFNEIIFGGKRIFKKFNEEASSQLNNISLETTFGYLDTPERNFLMTRPIDHIITQVQLAQFPMKYPLAKKTVMLNFKHPVKEMFFIVQNDAYKQYNNSIRFQEIKRVELRFNNQVAFDGNHEYLVYSQPMEHHVNIPAQNTMKYRYKHNEYMQFNTSSEFGIYSFAMEPEKAYPTGQVNMSRIAHQQLTIEIDPEILHVYCPKIYDTVLPNSDANEGTIPILLRFSSGPKSPGVKRYVTSKDNRVRVYAVNYNVLRISGGIAGLKF